MKAKVEIIEKNKEFLEDLVDFLHERSYQFKRQSRIDEIFLEKKSKKNILNYLIDQSPIELESVYGSTYQSRIRSNDQIYQISHQITSIEVTKDSFFANVDPTDSGEILEFEKGRLRPVFYKKKTEDSKLFLATFDIDFNINY